MTSAAIRAVFDCNIYLQALASPGGPAGRCVQLAIDGRVSLFLSPQVIAELWEVASRPNVVAKLKLDRGRVEALSRTIAACATLLDGFPTPFAYARDPDDAHYVNLALAAGAKLIVSRDKDLLDLMDESQAEAADFRHRFPTLEILDPPQFLQRVAIPPSGP